MDIKNLYLDFEFSGTSEANLDLVCCVTFDGNAHKSYWLHNSNCKELTDDLALYKLQGYTFIAYAVQAEARSMLTMQMGVLDVPWIDLYLEWRCLTNHNHKLCYGKQLIRGKVKTTKPPVNKYERTETDLSADHNKVEHNLAACCFKLLNIKIDTEHKTKMRNLIISAPKQFMQDDIESILDYCADDVKYLPALYEAILKQYIAILPKKNLKTLKEEILLRGEFAARTAIMEQLGYPINYEATKNFSDSVKQIIDDTCRDINRLFPNHNIFEFDVRKQAFVRKEKRLREWIASQNFNSWMKTEKGSLSLSLEAFTRYFSYSHTYPDNCLGAQMVRFLKLKQSLNGFLPIKLGSTRKSFWGSVGSDRRVRPYLGIYSSQSARSQPSSTGFIPLKAAWMRALIQSPNKMICGIDYGSQEFLLAALLSEDKNMVDAYQSGDPYFYFAKLAKAVPQTALRKDHEGIRDKFKSTTLGLQYGMAKYALATKLTRDTGKKTSVEEAEDLTNLFFEAFSEYADWQKETRKLYASQGHLQIPCGWYMYGDNDNFRSVNNFPIQGAGSSIMRKAVAFAQDEGLKVIFTLHDAIYIEFDQMGEVDVLYNCMKRAFRFYFKDRPTKDTDVRLDINIWGKGCEDGRVLTELDRPAKSQSVYIDPRSKKEYEFFKKYFNTDQTWRQLQ